MSPQGHKTAQTAIYVVGGLIGLTIVGGIVAFVVTADTAKSIANSQNNAPNSSQGNQNSLPINAGNTGTGSLPAQRRRRARVNHQLGPG